MPDAYRKTLIRQIAQHAHLRDHRDAAGGELDHSGTVLRRKAILIAKVQDEAGHGMYLYSAAETLGIDRAELLDMLHSGKQKYLDLQLPDADVGRLRRDRVARRRGRDHEPGASVPVLVRPVRARDDPGLQGGVVPPAAGGSRSSGTSSAARRSSRPWPRTRRTAGGPALMMFGPPDTGEAAGTGGHTEQSMAWGIKRFSNDDLRQKFVDMMVLQADKLGLARPRSALERGAGALGLRRGRLGRVLADPARRRAVQRRAH